MMRRLTWIPVLCLLLAGCDSVTGPPEPPPNEPESVPYDPPRIYNCWWQQVEADIGRGIDEDRWQWRQVVQGRWHSETFRGYLYGMTWIPTRTIYMASGFTGVEYAVKHEMAHAILGGDPEHKHPIFALYVEGYRAGLCPIGTW